MENSSIVSQEKHAQGVSASADPLVPSPEEQMDQADQVQPVETPTRPKPREFTEMQVEIPLIVSGNLREAFRKNLKKLKFRRVRTVFAKPEHRVETVFVAPNTETGDEEYVRYGPDDKIPVFSDEEYRRNVEEQYSEFYFFTTATEVRKGDGVKGGVYGHSSTLAVLDLTEFVFYPCEDARTQMMLPREGDLVCGFVSDAKKGKTARRGPEFTKWFLCSEQFLRAWTAIMYDEHDSLTKLANKDRGTRVRRPVYITRTPEEIVAIRRQETNEIAEAAARGEKYTRGNIRYVTPEELAKIEEDEEIWASRSEERLRKQLFCGNALQTNSYLKWFLSCYEDNLKSLPDEMTSRFWALRTEFASRVFVHVYAALVLMCRYGEFPCEWNIPNNIEGPRMHSWDVPAGWLDSLVARYGITAQTYARVVQVPHPFVEAPKGTVLKTQPAGEEYTVIVFSGNGAAAVNEKDL